MSERIPWTVPVPGHHTTRQGGRTTKGGKERWQEKRGRGWGKKKKRRRDKRGRWTRRENREGRWTGGEDEKIQRPIGRTEEQRRGREDAREAEWEELKENNRERWGGTGYATFLLTTASNQSKRQI